MKDENEQALNEQIDNLTETMTLDQIDELAKALDMVPKSADTQLYEKSIAESHDNLQGEKTVEAPVVDIGTGRVTAAVASLNINSDIDIDDIMNLDKIQIDYENTKITSDIVVSAIDDLAPCANLSSEDISTVSELAKRKLNGANLNWYANLPDSVKELIDQISMQGAIAIGNKNMKFGRRRLAEGLLDSIGAKGVMQTAQKDLNAAMGNTLGKLNEDSQKMLTKFFSMMMEQYTVNYPAQADEYERAIADGKIKEDDLDIMRQQIEIYRNVSHSFIQSYTYEDMLNTYKAGKIKIKKIQIDKFERTLHEFDFKYNNVDIGIDSIVSIVPIIARMVGDNVSPQAVKKFVVMFVNYTKMMKPENIVDHVFMYYFIKHIISTVHFDYSNPDETKFYGELTERITNIIKMLDTE